MGNLIDMIICLRTTKVDAMTRVTPTVNNNAVVDDTLIPYSYCEILSTMQLKKVCMVVH